MSRSRMVWQLIRSACTEGAKEHYLSLYGKYVWQVS